MKPISEKFLAAAVKVVEYMEEDEREHFEEMKASGEPVNDHIYFAVKTLRDELIAMGLEPRRPQEEFRKQFEELFASLGVDVV
jgi:hypothetical protein